MPGRWTLPRVVNRLHRDVLASAGFERRGNRCARLDNGLLREMRFYTPRSGDPATKGVQVFLIVEIAGFPEPLVEFRRDALWTHLEPVRQLDAYPRPASGDSLPPELIEDVAGPGMDFLCHAPDVAPAEYLIRAGESCRVDCGILAARRLSHDCCTGCQLAAAA